MDLENEEVEFVLSETDSALETDPLNKTDTNVNTIIKDIVEKHIFTHNQTVKSGKLISIALIFVAFCAKYWSTAGDSLFVLYVKQVVGYENTALISVVMCIGVLSDGTTALILASRADIDHKFDNYLVLVILLSLIGTTLLAFGTKYFILVAIGYIFFEQPNCALCNGYIARILGFADSQYYIVLLYQVRQVAQMIGPIIASIIVSFRNCEDEDYTLSYIHLFGICAFTFIFCLIFIYNSENKLENEQLSQIVTIYKFFDNAIENNEDFGLSIEDIKQNQFIVSKKHRFPLSMRFINDCTGDDDKLSIKNIKYNGYTQTVQNLTPKQEFYQNIVLFNFALQNAFTVSTEDVFSTWYIIYMIDYFDVDIVIASIQRSIRFVFVIFGMEIIKYLNKYLMKKYKFIFSVNNISYLVLFINYFICILFTLFLCPMSEKNLYWSYMMITGLFFGILAMTQEMIILDIQPNNLTGRISGLKVFIRGLARASIFLVIGLTWETNMQWFWYTQGIAASISCFILFITVIITKTQLPWHVPAQ